MYHFFLDWHNSRWFLAIALVGVFFILKYARAFKLFLAWSWLLSVFAGYYGFASAQPIFIVQAKKTAFIGAMMTLFCVVSTRIKINESLGLGFLLLSCILTFFTVLFHPGWIGPGIQISVNSTLLAVLSVFIFKSDLENRWKAIAVILVFSIMLFAGPTMGPAALIVGLCGLILFTQKKLVSIIALALGPILVCLPFLWQGKDWFIPTGRIPIWSMAWMLIEDPISFVFGRGRGTWQFIGPWFQKKENILIDGYFITLHNDWLQLIFETGMVGASLFLLGAIRVLSSSKKSPWAVYLVFVFCASMLGNFPLQLPIESFIFFSLCGECIVRNNRVSQTIDL